MDAVAVCRARAAQHDFALPRIAEGRNLVPFILTLSLYYVVAYNSHDRSVLGSECYLKCKGGKGKNQ